VLEQPPDPGQFRQRQKITSSEGLQEPHHDRVDTSPDRPDQFVLMPDMGQVGPQHDQVTRRQGRNLVPHQAIAGTPQHQGDLELRVEVPRGVIARPANDFATEGFPLALRCLLEYRFH